MVPADTPVGRVFPKVSFHALPVVVVLVLSGREGEGFEVSLPPKVKLVGTPE